MTNVFILTGLLLSATVAETVGFDTDVMPVLTKAGCNTGACHGAASGRGGLRLSLYGGDPAADYAAIVEQLEGRRINLVKPSASLLLAKPTERLEHGGGQRLSAEGAGARLIEQWIAQGAMRAKTRTLVRLEVSPSRQVLARPLAEVRLSATATFSDGSRRDVTDWTLFTADDPEAVKVDDRATARVLRRGQHTVIARFLDRVAPVRLIVPLADEPVDLSQLPRRNFIDEQVLTMLGTLRLPPLAEASDAELLRRLRLDLTGRLPTPDEVREHLSDRRVDKHEALVDRLLRSEEFTEYWAYQFAKLLRVQSPGGERPAGAAYHAWLRKQIAGDSPLDAMARELLLAVGDSHAVGPANFHRIAAGPREQAELVSEVFLGARLRCANCHNHPFDRWTQDDYHGLAAIFARLERGRQVRQLSRGEVSHPATGEAATPRLPGARFLDRREDPRTALADWLTAKASRLLARAMVNRLWKALLGRGLIEPVDDLRATNPATHPELLVQLADDFAAQGYRIRHTLRLIATSAAYRRAAARPGAPQAADDRFYSRALSKSLAAEVLADALCDVTGVAERYVVEGQPIPPPGTRAIALVHADAKSPALDILGRCDRRESCDVSSPAADGLRQKLHFLNGELINAKLAASEGRLRRQIEAGRTNDEMVTEFYLRALSRSPTEKERSHWKVVLGTTSGESRRQALEDFAWAILNCREFVTNH